MEQVVADIRAGRDASEVDYGRQDIDFDRATARRARRLGEHGQTPLSHSQKKALLFEPEVLRTVRRGEGLEPGERFSIFGDKKSQSKNRQDLTTRSEELFASSSIDDAKIQKISENLTLLSEKYRGRTSRHGVLTDLASAIDAIGNDVSKYARREFDRIFLKNNLMNCCTVHFLFVSL